MVEIEKNEIAFGGWQRWFVKYADFIVMSLKVFGKDRNVRFPKEFCYIQHTSLQVTCKRLKKMNG